MEVQREYRTQTGKPAVAAALGEELTVHLKIRSLDHAPVWNVAILDLLPGGFEVVADSIRKDPASADKTCDSITPDYVDIREDRIVVYGSAEEQASEFIYKIRATNRGTYIIPPVQAESMYRRSLQARGTPGTITVKD